MDAGGTGALVRLSPIKTGGRRPDGCVSCGSSLGEVSVTAGVGVATTRGRVRPVDWAIADKPKTPKQRNANAILFITFDSPGAIRYFGESEIKIKTRVV